MLLQWRQVLFLERKLLELANGHRLLGDIHALKCAPVPDCLLPHWTVEKHAVFILVRRDARLPPGWGNDLADAMLDALRLDRHDILLEVAELLDRRVEDRALAQPPAGAVGHAFQQARNEPVKRARH